ncbi:hypothetical protein FHX08_002044 [Rhizobium sp. BK529]|uniref:hypothetical protein n=1 Tax=Rhizobium sp. BK529 TaxID=2586983 RepID=UPI00161D1CE3|nr:hypothetical protein [Rhizobium sp. BK529]MBB3591700.1 hypothetical protein [Rhizobium sp. BK529]
MTEFASPLVTEGQAIFVFCLMTALTCGVALLAVVYAAGLAAGLKRTDRAEAEEIAKDL